MSLGRVGCWQLMLTPGAADSGPPRPHCMALGLSFLLRTTRGLDQLFSKILFSPDYSVTQVFCFFVSKDFKANCRVFASKMVTV